MMLEEVKSCLQLTRNALNAQITTINFDFLAQRCIAKPSFWTPVQTQSKITGFAYENSSNRTNGKTMVSNN